MNPQGLTAITIENFKGIGQAVTIPLRPVTLLFGANSAGKSTIIQALQYAWEILENRNADVDRTRLGGEVIDLGGFQNLVHGHDVSRSISITLHYSGGLKDEAYRAPEFYDSEFVDVVDILGGEHADVTDWLDVKEISVKVTSTWEPGAGAYISGYEVGINGATFGRIRSDQGTSPELFVNADHPIFSEEAIAGYSDYGRDLIREIYYTFADPENAISRALSILIESELAELVKEGLTEAHKPEDALGKPENDAKKGRPPRHLFDPDIPFQNIVGENIEEIVPRSRHFVPYVIPEWGRHVTIRRIKSESTEESSSLLAEATWVLSQLLLGAGEAVLQELRGLRYVGPLRAVPERVFASPLQLDAARWANGLAAWDCLLRWKETEETEETKKRKEVDPIPQCNHYLNEELGLGYTVRRDTRIQLSEDSTILSELRLFAAQYDERDGTDLLRRVLEPLERLPRIAALQLHDEKRDIDIDPMDIGVGVSQTLPVVVGAVEPNCTIFAVEQPELHIHPAVQSRMGDLFLRECLGRPGRIFLLETHSEHLMLRMLRRIRETADGELPPGYPPVTPEDVQVLYVESEGGITSIVPLPITEDGDFAQKWPHGFFTEREEDLF